MATIAVPRLQDPRRVMAAVLAALVLAIAMSGMAHSCTKSGPTITSDDRMVERHRGDPGGMYREMRDERERDR